MFYYYGAKRRLASRYPAPAHGLVIEPFAGAAGYSMYWGVRLPELRIHLIEKDERVVQVWHTLLDMTPEQIAAYPVPAIGRTTDRFVMFAAASNAIGVSSALTVTPRMQIEFARMRKSAAKLRHALGGRITVEHGDYSNAANDTATWFVDPPYSRQACRTKTARPGGRGYARGCSNNDLDYTALGRWCRSRKGQVIACEHAGASWLDFVPLCTAPNTLGKQSTEAVWVA